MLLCHGCSRWPTGFAPNFLARQAKIAEQRLDDLQRHAPIGSGFRSTSYLTPFTGPGALKTHDWFLLASPAGKYALRGLLPAAQEVALFALFDAVNLCYSKVVDAPFVERMRQQLVAALHGIEMHFPSTELDMKLHILVHFPDQILRAGPLWCTAMWPYERTYKAWRGFIRNRAFPQISVMNGVVLYQQTLRAREQLRQGQGFALETEGEGRHALWSCQVLCQLPKASRRGRSATPKTAHSIWACELAFTGTFWQRTSATMLSGRHSCSALVAPPLPAQRRGVAVIGREL
jgi:hypothetical protein